MVPVRRIGMIAALTAALMAGSSFGASAETLIEALAKAYETNPQLLSERAALRATDEEVPQAISNWRPTVTVTGEAGKERIDTDTSTVERDPRVLELEIVQPLYRGGRTVVDTRRAKAVVAAGRAQLLSTEQQVLLAAVRAYMNVVRDLAVLELNRNNEQRLQRQLQAAQDRFRVGEITRTDVAQAEARVAGATAARIQAEGALVDSRANYRSIVGDMPGTLTPPADLLQLPATEEEAEAAAVAQNPAVLFSHYNAEAARHEVRLVKGELLPRLDLRGAVSTEENTTDRGSSRDTAEILATLTVPLYDGGDTYSRLRAAKEVLSQRLEEFDDARRSAIEEATNAWNALQTTRAAVRSFESEVRASEIALEGVQREALVGSRTVLDVLDAEQELLDARVNLVSAQRDEVVARFALKAAGGSLTARELNLPVALYDPENNYEDVRGQWFGADKPERPVRQ